MPVLLLRSHLRPHWDLKSIVFFSSIFKQDYQYGSVMLRNFINFAPIASIAEFPVLISKRWMALHIGAARHDESER
jgi:hypothetical protein